MSELQPFKRTFIAARAKIIFKKNKTKNIMSISDQWIKIIITGLIILYLCVLVTGYFTHKFAYFTSFLNAATGASILIYWITRQMQIEQHIIEAKEVLILLFEVIVIACAVFYIIGGQKNIGLKVLQYVFYGTHLIAMILFFIFMVTFKINRLM